MSQPNHPIDRLTEQARIRGASRMMPEGSKAADVTEAIARVVVDGVLKYKKEHDLVYDEIARDIGKTPSVLSEVVKFKYAGDWRSVILDLDRWLDAREESDKAPKPAEFVETKVAEEIATIASAAIALRTIALVYGPETSGLGKTMALQAVAAEKPGCIMVTVDKVRATAGGVLEQICKRLRIGYSHNDAWCFQKIVDHLKGTSRLLIVDQIHNLCGARKDKPFYMLADLQDRTNAPQLWCGTSDIVAYLRRGQAKGEEPLSQIRSRIGMARDLTQRARSNGGGGGKLFSVDEIRKVFGQGKMRLTPDAARYLMRLANLPDSGALRTCKNLVVMAETMYGKNGGDLTLDMLRAAHHMLVPDASYTLLQAELDQAAKASPAMKIG
jgi:DNA transposition AAA+ family ATPase